MAGKTKSLTIMFIPEGKGKTLSMHVRRPIIYSLLAFFIMFILGMGILVYLAGDIAVKLQLVYSLRNENQKLKRENNQLRQTTLRINDIRHINEYISRMLKTTRNTSKANILIDKSDKDSVDMILENIRTSHNNQVIDFPSPDTVVERTADVIPYLRPVEGWITKKFVVKDLPNEEFIEHNGIDIAAVTGTPIRAPAPGVVEEITVDTYFGKTLTLEHPSGFVTRYGHCSQILVTKGALVSRGQTIALVGNTGNSTAPHLHYEMMKEGVFVDPMRYILTRQQ